MPYTIKTLGDIKQSLADRHESNGVLPTSSAVLTFWTRLINKGVAYCADRLRLEKSASLTTSSGTIALPDDFLIANSVVNSDNVDLVMVASTDLPKTGLIYWITGNQTDGFSLNTPTDTTYTVRYSFKPVELSTDADKCIIPDPEAVVSYAYAMIRKAESDPFEDADKALAECDSRLAEMNSAYSINTDSIGLSTY